MTMFETELEDVLAQFESSQPMTVCEITITDINMKVLTK
jgi:hypothetical protein